MGDGAGPQCRLQAHCKAGISALGFRPCGLGQEGTEPQLDKRTPNCTEHCPGEPERETMPWLVLLLHLCPPRAPLLYALRHKAGHVVEVAMG